MKTVDLYTDGACRGNPGPGGYGIVLRFTDSSGEVHEKQLSAGFGLTTNNRMELLAAIVGLESLKEPCFVNLFSDSQYLVNAHKLGWLDKWKALGWFRDKKRKEPVKNSDLWIRLEEASAPHFVQYIWVKGHENNTYNNLCDKLAVEAALDREHYLAESFLEESDQLSM